MRAKIIDHNFISPNVIASYLLESSDGIVLIESGPESTFGNVVGELKSLGLSPGDVRHVFVTHIHLDHSGGAWRYAREGAKIYVHPNGAPHLADPGRLVSSAAKIFGDRMGDLWGEVRPIAKENITVVEDGGPVSVGGLEIRAFDTPGHAGHHHCYLADGVLFTGDAAGVRIGGGAAVPPTPPPEIHVELWLETLKKIRGISPDSICPTHFGEYADVSDHLDDLSEALEDFSLYVGHRLEKGMTGEEISSGFEAHLEERILSNKAGAGFAESYKNTDTVSMNVKGIVRYWKKFRMDDPPLPEV